jgi:hypothetical protein
MRSKLQSTTRGAALVIVLACVVLLTALAVAFFTRATTDRQISFNSSGQTKADFLAQAALAATLGDLKQEIAAGSVPSTPTPSPSTIIYLPRPSPSPSTVTPALVGSTGSGGLENLVKRSANGVRFYPPVSNYDTATYPPANRAAGPSSQTATTVPSQNSRSVSLARWNKPLLLQKANPASDTDPTPVNTFIAPDWVLVARDGSNPTSWNANLITSPNNATSVLGRYAYTIYDEGGLLNMNLAGYPTVSTVVQVGLKGAAAYADLKAVAGITGLSTGSQSKFINNIVGWRNYASAAATGGALGTFQSGATYTFPSGLDYYNSIQSNTNGFLLTSNASLNGNQSDRMLSGRQQLIALLVRGMASTAADRANLQVGLEDLGTFSREATTPSWRPDYDASERGGSATYAYKTNAPNSSSINRDLNTVRVGTVFTRFDGTLGRVSEPLLKKRFPLNRLAWITYKGPSADVYNSNTIPPYDPVIAALLAKGVTLPIIQAGTAANIKACFGLVWDSRSYVAPSGTSSGAGQQWVYTSPNSANFGGTFNGTSGTAATVIKILDTVRGENREPDFFELLQACILTGSLGQNTGGGTTNTAGGSAENPPVFPDIHMNSTMHHLLSIGSAIIDQADPDSFPTRLRMDTTASGNWLSFGAEKLPYITEICPIAGVSAENSAKWATYLLFQLWDPNESISAQPPVRLRIDGGIGIFNGNGQVWPNGGGAFSGYVGSNVGINVTIPVTSTFALTPFPMTNSKVSVFGVSQNSFVPVPVPVPGPDPTAKYAGFRFPDFTMPAGTGSQKPELWLQVGASNGGIANPFNVTMEVDLGGGTWVPYNYFVGINATTSWIFNLPMFVRAAAATAGTPVAFTTSPDSATRVPYCLMKSDPRATRFGVVQNEKNTSNSVTSHARIDVPLWEQSNSKYRFGFGGTIGTGASDAVEHVPLLFNGTKPYDSATLCLNSGGNPNNYTSYADPDGVQRYGDAGYQSNSGNDNSSTPYDVQQLQYQPVVLNRPFRNVGELGYTFRDLPWRSIDFFSQNSADAGLLDVFCVNDEPAMMAGRVNLNTRQASVIQAVMQAGMWDEYDTGNLIGTTQASGFCHSDTMAGKYANYIIQNGTLSNRSSLVTALYGTALTTDVLKPANGVGHENEGADTRREAIARSIASMSQTRTWNLMIDVIAQSGRYPPTATTLANFVVEGEKRYWLHVAIDRFTGEVIDQQLEAVYE